MTTESVVRQLVALGSRHELDPILGHYDSDNRAHVVAGLDPGELSERTDLREALANRFLDSVAGHLKADPRDVGES